LRGDSFAYHGKQRFQSVYASRCHNADLSQMRAHRIDQLCALTDQQIPRAVQHQRSLLLDRLHRHKAHTRPGHRLADRRRIGCIILRTLDVGFDVACGHQPHRMSESGRSRAQ
jgi:hypothetical protein